MRHLKILFYIQFFIFQFFLSCKNTDGFAPSTAIPTDAYELVYGSSLSDRTKLADRIAGNEPPKLQDVVANWKRFSGPNYFSDSTAIIASPAYCRTTLDGTGLWANGTNPGNGATVNPNINAECNTATMNSLSWTYLAGPDRLFNIQNTNNYNGFFSSTKLDTYTSETNVSSTDTDDDSIGVTIAIYIDSVTGEVNTLSAMRTQGGNSPTLGWALLHKKNNTIVRVIGEKSVGGTNRNNGAGGGDSQGWNSRYSKIKIERTGNIVKAFASVWGSGPSGLTVDPASEITVDLSQPAENLTGFMGPQAYGYESMSQARATFSDLKFITPLIDDDPQYLFDLKDNLVYQKKTVGLGYELLSGAKALSVLGFPKTIYNSETQKSFSITSETAFEELL